MQEIFEKVKTPFKYGVVLTTGDSSKMADSPSIFRLNNTWYMTYIVFDGRGYETWLAESKDLLEWETKGRILSFTDSTWDATQKAAYLSLLDTDWENNYRPMQADNRYWASYLGGSAVGYEAGRLGVGMAHAVNPAEVQEWTRLPRPVLSADDADARWYDNKTIYKSSIIYDKEKLTGHPYIMYYNAAGDSTFNGRQFESIAMAVSDDMVSWKRLGDKPLLTKGRGICGDAQVVKIGEVYVMFFFGYDWEDGNRTAFDRFACSYDLVNWAEWTGENLVEPSEPYDRQYAHKPCVINWNGVVYHFYNAVGDQGRVIALATSKDIKNP
ncbi:MAG: glycosylase [Chitinophagaceae bacterium]|nr:glycosylase [Chitinophagaceae bacterium]MCW5926123.1 glycosylase [Chitinophagaceae bacterium]